MAEPKVLSWVKGASGWLGLVIAVLALIMMFNLAFGGGLNKRIQKVMESEATRIMLETQVKQQLEAMENEVEAIDERIQGHLQRLDQLNTKEEQVRREITQIESLLEQGESELEELKRKIMEDGF